MKKFINVIIGIVLLIMSVMNCFLANRLADKTEELIELTNVEPEIIFLDSLVYDTVFIEKTQIVKLPIYYTDTIQTTDTIIHQDSVYVEVPIELKHFSDTLLNNTISFDLRGFQCEVNNLYVKNFLNVPTQEKKVKRWGLGLQLGMGACKDYFSPYIGVGLNYNLIQF